MTDKEAAEGECEAFGYTIPCATEAAHEGCTAKLPARQNQATRGEDIAQRCGAGPGLLRRAVAGAATRDLIGPLHATAMRLAVSLPAVLQDKQEAAHTATEGGRGLCTFNLRGCSCHCPNSLG